GVFMRAHCPHPRLFEEEYKRSNRNRGTKILRCFPHCCPHHVDRSYCGSPLEVVLRFGDESDITQAVDQDNRGLGAPFDVANVFVFARFETVDGRPLGGDHSLRYMRSVSQSEMNPEASWIEGVRHTAADRQQHSQQLHGRQLASRLTSSRESTRPDSATFVLNGQAFAKWYYHWESGANKVQRATKHALKAYVFYQTQEAAAGLQHRQHHGTSAGVQQDPIEDGTLELLCVVMSPSFTVVSYRRAPLEASASGALGLSGIDGSASLMPHYATDTAHPVDARLRRIVQHQISRAFREYDQQQQQYQSEPRGASDEQKVEEDRSGSEERGSSDRYRQLQEREGLRFRLLTPEDAALSGSSLHSQIQPREPRLVFDCTTRREDAQQCWRDVSKDDDHAFGDDDDDDDIRDEAVAHPLTPGSWTALGASDYESKAAGPVGMPPSATDSARRAEKAARAAMQRFKQQQQQLGSHQRELHQLTDLAIVHFFVSRVTTNSARSLANLEVVLTIAISQHWRYASGGATHLARLLLALPNGEANAASVSRSGSFAETQREELMLVLGEVCVWAFSPENLGLVQSLLSACHPLLLENLRHSTSGGVGDGGKELRAAFLACVGRCWSALDGFMQTPRATQTTIRSARDLSDSVLGVVFSDPELVELRSGLRTMFQRPTIVLDDSKENNIASLGGHGAGIPRLNLAGWEGFVAQVREGYLRDQYSGRGLPWSPMQGTNARPSRWAADWLLEPGSLSATSHADNPRRTALMQARAISPAQDVPSMWTSCLALSQLLHLKLAVVGEPLHTLYVQAEPSVLSPDNAWLRLICDGRVRVAPVAPNGLTSLMCGASNVFGGDYVAYRLEHRSPTDASTARTDDGGSLRIQAPGNLSNHSSICVEFYCWPLQKEPAQEQDHVLAFRSVATLKIAASGTFMEGRMDLECGFVDREAIAAAESPRLELWAPTERVQAVANWSSWLSIEGMYARK
ncbi:hypothetical protein PF011_g28121, partial [Phytophthora fragariae]